MADARRRRGLAEQRRQQAGEENQAGERSYREQVLVANWRSGVVIFNSQRQFAGYKVLHNLKCKGDYRICKTFPVL